jgi:DNA-binding transcriptional LysR family regulator
MNHWTEMRTALMVARHGTISAAASALGVHRATVGRHIEVLEAALAARLFLRHARGYTLTEAGRDLLEVANRADEMFADLEGRSRGRVGQLSGELVVTALAGVAPLVMPIIKAMNAEHPGIAIEFVADARLARLEYGEAHIAFRAGPKPDEPDYVVLPFRRIRFGLYAHRGYVERVGRPEGRQFEGHRFIGSVGTSSRLPFAPWMDKHVAASALALRTTEPPCIRAAVAAGLGLGFLAEYDASDIEDLVEILPPSDEWSTDLWIVTHGDLHRTAKVQAFLRLF